MIFLRRSIPLNMLSLECGELNDALIKIIDGMKAYIVDDYIVNNHNLNRRWRILWQLSFHVSTSATESFSLINQICSKLRINSSIPYSICDSFEEISRKVSDAPETVQELVALQNYVLDSRDTTMYNLKEKIKSNADYVLFLMQYSLLPGMLFLSKLWIVSWSYFKAESVRIFLGDV